MKRINKQGYTEIKINNKWILEHKKVAQDLLKRELDPSEIIHHINLNKTDNRKENLMLFKNQKEHSKFHIKLIKFPYLTNPMKREIERLKICNIKK